jgi:hypothetical protein
VEDFDYLPGHQVVVSPEGVFEPLVVVLLLLLSAGELLVLPVQLALLALLAVLA